MPIAFVAYCCAKERNHRMQITQIKAGQWYETVKGPGQSRAIGPTKRTAAFASAADDKTLFWLTAKEILHEIHPSQAPTKEEAANGQADASLRAAGELALDVIGELVGQLTAHKCRDATLLG